MVKVLHLIKTLNLGGAELNLFNLVREINPKEFEIHVGYSFGGEFEEGFRKEGVRLFKFARGRHKIKSLASLGIIFRIIIYILKNKIDIIHTHTFNAHIWGATAAKLTRRKIVEHVHDSRYLAPDEFKKRREFSRQYKHIKLFGRISDKVIVLTEQNYAFLRDNNLYDESQIRKIHNGIPFSNRENPRSKTDRNLRDKLDIKEDNLIILTPSRLSPEKNVDLIFELAPRVREKYPKAVFIISGDGPLFEEFRKKTQELKLEDTVRMIGFYPQIFDLLEITDIFLLPSLLELHSIAILEALSMKVPVVVSKDVGSNDEFIKDWHNGVLINPFGSDGWAEAIIKLLGDKELRRAIGQRGYELCQNNFDIQDVTRRIERVYVELIGK